MRNCWIIAELACRGGASLSLAFANLAARPLLWLHRGCLAAEDIVSALRHGASARDALRVWRAK